MERLSEIIRNIKDIKPEYSNVVDDNFWDLIDKQEDDMKINWRRLLSDVWPWVALILLLCAISCMIMAGNADAAGVILQWDANTEPDLAGYKVYYGEQSGEYGAPVNVGNVTEYKTTLSGEMKTFYFAVTAFDTEGLESGYSNEVSATLPNCNPIPVTGLKATVGGCNNNITININTK